MSISFLLQVFGENPDEPAIVWKDQQYTYDWLLDRIEYWGNELITKGVDRGSVVVLEGDFSPNSIGLFLALIQHDCVIVPLANSETQQREQFRTIARGQVAVTIDQNDDAEFTTLDGDGQHPLYDILREEQRAGLVVFSSGSTGESKATVHDLLLLIDKFKVRRRKFRSVAFLLFDHLGGINTILYSLSNGGCLVVVGQRSPDTVLAAVEAHQVDLLPISPTFINLILLSGSYENRDLSSLKIVSYGTEPMPTSTLVRFHELFPEIELQQTYGLSELGVLRSKSRSSDSLWVKVGGDEFQTRVIDGVLQIKADSAMLGYLNAPSPFTEDGWFDTGDSVEVDGEYFRFQGRQSELISVGGQKVHPSEIESVIQEMEEVAEATVYAEPNPIIGNIVCAKVRVHDWVDEKSFPTKLKKFCRAALPSYKVPIRVIVDDQEQTSSRFKKIRRQAASNKSDQGNA